jgi:prepilin-type N-terminal cleavage/methylation domain-containing protein
MKNRGAESRGFTLVEVVVALLLTALAMLAIAPLFVGGMKNNAVGWDYSSLNELAKRKIEEILQMNFNDPRVVVPGGTTVTIDGTVVKGKLFLDNNPNSVTINGKTFSYPYELVYVVQDYALNDIPASGAPLPANAKDDSDPTWSGANPVRYVTVYAASSRKSLQGTAYSSAGLLSSAAQGKQVRMSAVKSD